MSTLKTIGGPQLTMRLGCRCKKCPPRYHDVRLSPSDPARLFRALAEWEYKHAGPDHELMLPVLFDHDIPRDLAPLSEPDFPASPPWWHPDAGFQENTSYQISYNASAALTFTSVNSLASTAGLLAGASSLAVDNGATGAPISVSVGGFIKNNTTTPPTAGNPIEAWAYCNYDDTPTYPDTIAGTDAAKTLTTTAIKQTGLVPIGVAIVAATTSQVNPFAPVSVAALFGDWLPRLWGVFVVQNSGQALAASGNTWSYKSLYVAS